MATTKSLGMSLDLSKGFDFSKLEVMGGYSLKIRSYHTFEVFMMKYGNNIVYIPNLRLNELKELSQPIFELFEKWCGIPFYSKDYRENNKLSSVYYNRSRRLFPDYEFKKGDKKIYNLMSFKNRLSEKNYHIAYGFYKTENETHLGEGLYRKNELISTSIQKFNYDQDAVYESGSTHIVVDLKTGKTTRIENVERITAVTNRYIAGSNSNYQRDMEDYVYRLKFYQKSDGKVLYNDNREHYSAYAYKIIGDRYLAVNSCSDGVIDLETGSKISYPFANVCENFISHVSKAEFVDDNGVHPIKELPDMSWTGYETTEFIKKFHGFIPDKNRIGRLALNGTGGYEQHNRKWLVFKDVKEGMFYKKRNELINLETEQSIKVDDTMMKWITKRETVYVFEKKPRDVKRFSILEALKNGKELYGMYLSSDTLYHQNYKEKKRVKTNFMKNEIVFNIQNIVDIKCNIQGKTPKFEIECKVNKKKITFETDTKYENFEVANIA